jgi:4-diphosphocytidyl-2-C-methyl-D-erythritol kinase
VTAGGEAHLEGDDAAAVEVAAAKLTVSLRVTGRRADGFHLLESEMVTLDLVDHLVIGEGDALAIEEAFDRSGVTARAGGPGQTGPWRAGGIDHGPDNLVVRALRAVGRTASVRLTKRIPPGAGLGGGSADAAAILRWSGRTDSDLAAGLGSDVPFCLLGGRALVRGVGEDLTPLPFEDQTYTLFLLPFGVDTGAVYAAWDRLHPSDGGSHSAGSRGPAWRRSDGPPVRGVNDLEEAAVAVEPRLAVWRDHLAAVTGRRPWLAGSGSTWFVEGTPDGLGLAGRAAVELGPERALVVPVRTTPAARPGAT